MMSCINVKIDWQFGKDICVDGFVCLFRRAIGSNDEKDSACFNIISLYVGTMCLRTAGV